MASLLAPIHPTGQPKHAEAEQSNSNRQQQYVEFEKIHASAMQTLNPITYSAA
jgi:hypothetical protein